VLLKLPVGSSGQTLTLGDQVLEYLSRHRQTRTSQPEAGGQLFAAITETEILVIDITGPRTTDKRFRFLYIPDRESEQEEIDARFWRGLHYVGDWHTHPEPTAKPSSQDLSSMRECVRKSKHHLNAFLLVIAGSAAVPKSLHVSLHSDSEVVALFGG
jgi:integrative and conjugative element protein (TIGR02256 family)